VYAVIRGEHGRIALVRTTLGLFLPGGGVEAGEGLEAALCREVLEECACGLRIRRLVGEALQYHDGYRSRHVFFAGDFVGPPGRNGEHELLWLRHTEAAQDMYHRSHAWAIGNA
jgi:8-oxo-dGTP diphosphatase